MRIKRKTFLYIVLGIVYSLTPTIIFALLSGRNMPAYTIYPIDVALVFTFTFVPLVIGFLAGEMFIDDMDESDPLYNPDMRKNKGL